MLHNQPKMVLKRHVGNALVFELAKDADIDVAKEWHMHAVTITVDNREQMSQLWTDYKEGRPEKSVEIVYHRVK